MISPGSYDFHGGPNRNPGVEPSDVKKLCIRKYSTPLVTYDPLALGDTNADFAELAFTDIEDLTTNATEASLVGGNYFALGGSIGTGKLPADIIGYGLKTLGKSVYGATRTITIPAGTTSNFFITFGPAISVGDVLKIKVSGAAGVITGYKINHSDYVYPDVTPARDFAWKADQNYSHNQNNLIILNSQLVKDGGGSAVGGTVTFDLEIVQSGLQKDVAEHDIDFQEVEKTQMHIFGDVADEFSIATSYDAGRTILRGEELYQFVANKSAGAWSSGSVRKAKVSDFMDKLGVLDKRTLSVTVSAGVSPSNCFFRIPFAIPKDSYVRITPVNVSGIATAYRVLSTSSSTGHNVTDLVSPYEFVTTRTDFTSNSALFAVVSSMLVVDGDGLTVGGTLSFDVEICMVGAIAEIKSIDKRLSAYENTIPVSAEDPATYYPKALKKEIENLKKYSDFTAIMLSDVHGGSTNVDRAIKIAEAIEADAILNGGDTVTSKLGDGVTWYNNLIDATTIPVITAIGNHDAWSADWVWDSNTDVYNAFISKVAAQAAPIVQPADAVTNGDLYYYKDFGSVRVIVLFSMTNAQWTQEQSDFFTSALADAKSNSKKVIVINHGPFVAANAVRDAAGWNSWKNYATGEHFVFDGLAVNNSAVAAVKDFIDAGGTFICWLSGHTHVDNTITHSSDDRQININMASSRYSNHTDGATSSDASNPMYDCLNLFGVDTTNGYIRVLRIGWNYDSCMQTRLAFSYDYINHKILAGNS